MAKANKDSSFANKQITLHEGHPLAGKTEPGKVYKAFSVDRVSMPENSGKAWIFIVITFQDGAITDIFHSEPDLKSIILEKFKIAVAKYWGTIG